MDSVRDHRPRSRPNAHCCAAQFYLSGRALADQVELVDERLTSFEARGLSNDLDAQHAIAARLIAESFLRSLAET